MLGFLKASLSQTKVDKVNTSVNKLSSSSSSKSDENPRINNTSTSEKSSDVFLSSSKTSADQVPAIEPLNVSPIKKSPDGEEGKEIHIKTFTDFKYTVATNVENIDFSHPDSQKCLFIYLLEKVHRLENRLNDSETENDRLRQELNSKLEPLVSLDSSANKTEEATQTTSDSSWTSSNSGSSESSLSDSIIQEISDNIKELQVNCARNTFDAMKAKNEIESLAEETSSKLKEIESYVIKTSQYGRRNNLIIDGIPDNIPQEESEFYCVDIIRRIGFPLQSAFESEGCHRLPANGKECRPTIIRFVNRKVKEFCIKNQWRLKKIGISWNLSFREDLESANADVELIADHLKRLNLIHHFKITNGFVKITIKKGDNPIKISHPSEIWDNFPDYDEMM